MHKEKVYLVLQFSLRIIKLFKLAKSTFYHFKMRLNESGKLKKNL